MGINFADGGSLIIKREEEECHGMECERSVMVTESMIIILVTVSMITILVTIF